MRLTLVWAAWLLLAWPIYGKDWVQVQDSEFIFLCLSQDFVTLFKIYNFKLFIFYI